MRVHDIDTPYTQENVKTPFLTTQKERKSRKSDIFPYQVDMKDDSKTEFDAANIANLVSKAIDDRMGDFLDKFQRVVSTNASRVSSVPSPKCYTQIDRNTHSSQSTNEMSCEAGKNSNTDDASKAISGLATVTDKRSFSKCDAAIQADSELKKRTTTTSTSASASTGTCSRLFGDMKLGSSKISPPTSVEQDDTVSIITHISQTSLMEGFFSNNPDLIPSSQILNDKPPKTVCSRKDSVKSGSLYQDQPAQICSTREYDSGYENHSLDSLNETSGENWPRIKLSQKFFDMGSVSTKQ